MADLFHNFGADLAIGPTGDLALSSGSLLTQQRVLRRLLTNGGDYIWQISYGGGLAQFIGQPGSSGQISAIVQDQLARESRIAKTPAAQIDVAARVDGTVTLDIRYADSTTGQTQSLSFSL
ncbi:MAG: hypothetical protein B7Z78_06355 [Rhodospirillales bacterium 20-60-12]|nr:MAG: hypothetical protein B7Z78_06355 [Rhodospirillales bacterium 20-60-12]HQT66016.1 hypothetical protein [Acetobacteraceae bacterium]